MGRTVLLTAIYLGPNYGGCSALEQSGNCADLEWQGDTLREEIPLERRYPTSKLSGGSREEILHVQGKRNPSKTVGSERGHQRADRLKPQSQKTSQSDHMDHSLV